MPSSRILAVRFSRVLLLAVGLVSFGKAIAVPVVHTSDFIVDSTRTGFNGFEAMGPLNSGYQYPGGNGPYQEDGILVYQVNGEFDTWSNFMFSGMEGARNWYPNGGDSGYTRITLAGNAQFDEVGFLVGGNSTVHYELYNLGALVLSGSLGGLGAWDRTLYLGFSGGGFDEINLSDRDGGVRDGSHNSLALDSIEIHAVPDGGSTTVILGLALVVLTGFRRQTRRAIGS